MIVKCPYCEKEFDAVRKVKKEYDVALFARMSIAVANATYYSMNKIRAQDRHLDVVDVRTCIVRILREEGVDVYGIASFIDRKPTSVSWLCKRYEDLQNNLKGIYNNIRFEMEKL